jgi:hypothetical protein
MTGASKVLRVSFVCMVPGSTASWSCEQEPHGLGGARDLDEVGVADQDQYREVCTSRSWSSAQPVNECSSPIVFSATSVESGSLCDDAQADVRRAASSGACSGRVVASASCVQIGCLLPDRRGDWIPRCSIARAPNWWCAGGLESPSALDEAKALGGCC